MSIKNIHYNADTDTWPIDTKEQPYLMPGTESYEAMQEVNEKQEAEKQGDEFHQKLEERNEELRGEQYDKNAKSDNSADASFHKFRKQRAKQRVQKQTEKIVEAGIGKNVNIDGSIEDIFAITDSKLSKKLVYDDSVDATEYQEQIIRSYKSEFKDACDEDNNGDGQIDSDDWTPGMRKMSKYL